MKCIRCNEEYGAFDDLKLTQKRDPEWDEQDRRCYGCYLGFLYEMYGGMMEPVIEVSSQCEDIYF